MTLFDSHSVTTVAFERSAVEEIALHEGDPIVDLALARHLPRDLDQPRVELDADAARAVFLRGQDDDASVPRPEVVHHVVRRDAGELEHRVRDRLGVGTKWMSGLFVAGWPRRHPKSGQQNRQQSKQKEGELTGRVALVAGATRGAGRGIARALGEAGATIYCTGRSVKGKPSPYGRPETIDETAAMIKAAGGTAIACASITRARTR